MSTITSVKKILASKRGPCVTIIIPTHNTSPERTVDQIEIGHTVKKVKENLAIAFGEDNAKELVGRLDDLVKTIDYLDSQDGIGLYISPEISEVIRFPFPVIKKTAVNEKFITRDLLYLQSYLEDYLFLSLSMEEAKLYRGKGKHLEEIVNKDFPKKFVDDYEYEKPSKANSYGNALKNTEGDKSIVTEERYERFLKDTDRSLSPYLKDEILLVVGGVKQEIGYFEKVTSHKENITAKLVGNYTHLNIAAFGEMVFEEISKARERINVEMVNKMKEAIGRDLAITGIKDVWKIAREGKGRTLLVEKDYIQQGFVKPGHEYLFLNPPVEMHQNMSDAVEVIMETVLEKNGRIIFTSNSALTNYEQIALVLRYP